MKLRFPVRLLCNAWIAGLLLAAGFAHAQVDVASVWVRGTVPGQQATGAFMTLHARQNAQLVGAASPVAGVVELHEMKRDGNVMTMRPVAGIDLPTMQHVELKPGGYHLMLFDLKQPLKKGDSVPLTLIFELPGKKTLKREVRAEVRDLTAPATADHAAHQH